MKHLLASSLAALFILGVSGCGFSASGDDDSTGDDDAAQEGSPTPTATPGAGDDDATNETTPTPAATPTPVPVSIEHRWLSEGGDVAPLLKAVKIVKVDATFNANQTYSVIATDKDGATYTYTGTYVVSTSSVPGINNITLEQDQPYEATAVGIYQIDSGANPARMTYEVVQTDPSSGATPPTAEAGFGSTGGVAKGSNVQYYNLQQ